MYECHITIEPVREDRLHLVETLAKACGFKPAKLLMQNRETGTPERSMYDTFLTGHAPLYLDLHSRMCDLGNALRGAGFHIWRYKIEHIILDSRTDDDYIGLLSLTSSPPPKAPQ